MIPYPSRNVAPPPLLHDAQFFLACTIARAPNATAATTAATVNTPDAALTFLQQGQQDPPDLATGHTVQQPPLVVAVAGPAPAPSPPASS